MSPISLAELKRALAREGFEIYRTARNYVLLADRVRDNLIMDSGVALGVAAEQASNAETEDEVSLLVRIVLRAQATEFPNEGAEELLGRARQLAEPFQARGYQETSTETVVITDPSDPERTLDTWHQVHWERQIEGLPSALEELRFALQQKRNAGGDGDD